MKKSKWIMLVAAILPLSLFLLPLWGITLEAPQYPQSIGMEIWITHIEGMNENDLQNINLMNHYVGMKEIPEHMPEFDLFPYVVIGLSLLGIVIGLTGKRNWYLVWFGIAIILGIAGMYDFYQWEYVYGHDLNPHAAIKIPGQGYQPPLIGRKLILNFTAVSMPLAGAYLLFLSMVLSVVAFLIDKKSNKGIVNVILILIIPIAMSCKPSIQEIAYGSDACNFCSMNIVDKQHASQLVTNKGKNYKFDAIECMIHYLEKNNESEMAYVLVSDFADPGQFLAAKEAVFVIDPSSPSPMGASLSAFSAGDFVKSEDTQVKTFEWSEVKEVVKEISVNNL